MFCSETTFAGFPTTSLTIMSSAPSGGTVTPAPNTYSVPQNTVEVLSAARAPGYYLENWTGNVAQPNSLTTTIVIGAAPQSVTANFQLHDFKLAVSPTSLMLPLDGTTATSDLTCRRSATLPIGLRSLQRDSRPVSRPYSAQTR